MSGKYIHGISLITSRPACEVVVKFNVNMSLGGLINFQGVVVLDLDYIITSELKSISFYFCFFFFP